MSAGLLVAKRMPQHSGRVEVSALVQQCIFGRREHAGDHSVAQDPALGESPNRVESHPRQRFSVPDHVADHGDERDRVLAEVDDRVGGSTE
ncbi:hypothetical protein I551_1029 [Mycobacterium ulcerans str. Harvey]|uniref:Uncharacterized protein n=1 Tax=Mycobacterium ulcerans str. Harvey TaxID=1299332 RepID=A0ABP3ARA7_MYCUL|nr:hypothetical protein I551_1029 [Mycobacterium ulcerans str. Harvey]